MQKLKVLELFGGIGACSTALKRLNLDYEIVDYVEIDKYAVKSFNAIHNTNFEPQDISKWDKDVKVDLIMHGSPCQDFSLAGKQAGGDVGSGTRSSLMYETIRIVEKLKPKYVIWENVKNLLSQKHKHNFNNYLTALEKLGYINYYQILNAKDYGIPQNRERERVFTISIHRDCNKDFEFPIKQELKLKLKDMLDEEVDEKYYLSEKLIQNLKFNKNGNCNPSGKGINGKIHTDEVAPTLTTNKGEGPKVDVSRLYGVFDKDNRTHQGGSVYDQDGLSPTLTDMQGGYRQPCIEIKNLTKQGYLEAHDGDGVYISNIDKKRGTVQKEMIPTLKTSPDIGVVTKEIIIGSTQKHAAVSENGIVPTLTSSMGTGGGHVPMHNYDLRIRKLTPKECWKLMGFNEEEFERAEKVNSNAQLYKQAGNSIVVNVLQAIFKNLLMKEGKIMEKKDEVKIISYETNLMIDLEKLLKQEPDLFNDLVKDYPVEPNTKIIIEVKV